MGRWVRCLGGAACGGGDAEAAELVFCKFGIISGDIECTYSQPGCEIATVKGFTRISVVAISQFAKDINNCVGSRLIIAIWGSTIFENNDTIIATKRDCTC